MAWGAQRRCGSRFGGEVHEIAAATENVQGSEAATVGRASAGGCGVVAEDCELFCESFDLCDDLDRKAVGDVLGQGCSARSSRRSPGDLALGCGQELLDLRHQWVDLFRGAGCFDGRFQFSQAGCPLRAALYCHELAPVLEERAQRGDRALRGRLLGRPVEVVGEGR